MTSFFGGDVVRGVRWGVVVVGSDALLSSSPSLIWLQLGFGLARAVTIDLLTFFTGQISYPINVAKQICPATNLDVFIATKLQKFPSKRQKDKNEM